MQRITRAMEKFRADPDDPAAHVELSGRRDEIGRAEQETGPDAGRPGARR